MCFLFVSICLFLSWMILVLERKAIQWITFYLSADIDECSSSPCLNGGTCFNGIGHFYCSCPREYSGVVCETQGVFQIITKIKTTIDFIQTIFLKLFVNFICFIHHYEEICAVWVCMFTQNTLYGCVKRGL